MNFATSLLADVVQQVRSCNESSPFGRCGRNGVIPVDAPNEFYQFGRCCRTSVNTTETRMCCTKANSDLTAVAVKTKDWRSDADDLMSFRVTNVLRL